MITAIEKTKIEQVVNVFETGSIDGKYDALVVLKDGVNSSRQITMDAARLLSRVI